ncbi:MAG TPA: hypothetical protein VFE50_02490 [Cyclobacteriaceae bacterium]|nr:hypothetical protein [Cyclobacteriaceae bacterium]
MSINHEDILKLLDALKTEHKGADFSMKGFEMMAEELEGINGKYLYELYRGTSKHPHEEKLNTIAKAIRYSSFREFVESQKLGEDPVLKSIEGEYYCYIRMHLEEGKVLRSPVRIFPNKGRMSYFLKGGRLEYTGEVTIANGCLFVLMRSNDGTKSFYHVYRIGSMESPEVLQGIFSGISSDSNPIGGRAVLVRKNESFDSLTKTKMDLQSLSESILDVEKRIAGYFRNKSENNITIKAPYTFGPEDL